MGLSRWALAACVCALALLVAGAFASYSTVLRFSRATRSLTEDLIRHSEVQGIAADFSAFGMKQISWLMTGNPALRPSEQQWMALRNRVEAFGKSDSASPVNGDIFARMTSAVSAAGDLTRDCEKAVAEGAGAVRRRELVLLGNEEIRRTMELLGAADRAKDLAVAERSAVTRKVTATAALQILVLSLLGAASIALALFALVNTVRRSRLAERERLDWLLREKEALQRALDAESRMTELLESIGDGFTVLDGNFRHTYVNSEAARIAGKPRNELIGKTPWDTDPEMDRNQFQNSYRTAGAERTPVTFDRKQESSGRWFHYRLFRNPRAAGVSTFIHDVTDVKLTQEHEAQLLAQLRNMVWLFHNACTKLQASEQMLNAIIEGSNDLIAAVDSDFRYLKFNRAYGMKSLELSGGTLKAGMRVRETTSPAPDHLDTQLTDWGRALSGEEFTIEREMGVDETDRRTYQTHYTAIRDWSGRIIGASHIARDITPHRHAQLALKRANQNLEEEVQQRTREVREKEALLTEVHHRVKNNLQIVSSLLHMQAYLVADAKAKAALQDSENRVLSMAMIHEFLYQSATFSRVEIVAYLKRVVDHLSSSYGTVEARHAVTGDPATFLTLEQAIPCGLLVNELVSNSYKHAFAGRTGQITVEVARSGNRILLSVTDDGAGLPADFSISSHKSLGFKLIETLATRQLRGTLDVSSVNGTTVKIAFDAGPDTGTAV